MQLIIMKMKMTMKNRSHKYNINRPRIRLGHKYSKYKKCLSKLMLICITQHVSNIWNWIYEKVMQHWVEKKALLVKKVCILTSSIHFRAKGKRNKCLIHSSAFSQRHNLIIYLEIYVQQKRFTISKANWKIVVQK